MDSAFGVDHGDFEKGLGDAASRAAKKLGSAKNFGSEVARGYKAQRKVSRAVRSEYGLPSTLKGNLKAGYQAGKGGYGRQYRNATNAARRETMDIMRGGSPRAFRSEGTSYKLFRNIDEKVNPPKPRQIGF